MSDSGKLIVKAQGDREIVMTRSFNAPRHRVFEAWTKPELLKRWLLGPDGWSMPVCTVDLRVGGTCRFVWKKDSTGDEMGMTITYLEIVPNEKIIGTEKFDQPWYEGEAHSTLLFTENAGRTTVTNTVRYANQQTRDGVLKSPMEQGVGASYDRLEQIVSQEVAA
jgi:uncharacterized protein YndB with AHSA1/START domain